jgi:hypothetical protein
MEKLHEHAPCDGNDPHYAIISGNGRHHPQNCGREWYKGLGVRVATELGLPNPEAYTSHCWRGTAATIMGDEGVDRVNLKRAGGWRSDSSLERYLRDSKKLRVDTSSVVQGLPASTLPPTSIPPATIGKEGHVIIPQTASKHDVAQISFNNCTITNIHF